MAKLMVHAIQKRRQSAPSAAFFLNSNGNLSSSSNPNLSKGMLDQDSELHKEKVYTSRPDHSPPILKSFETPLQGFQVVKPNSLLPRELSGTPPKGIITPKPRTPVSTHLYDKMEGLEHLLCELINKFDTVSVCSSSPHSSKRRMTRTRTGSARERGTGVSLKAGVSLKVRIFREQRHIRQQLASLDRKMSQLSRRIGQIRREEFGEKHNLTLDEIVSGLNLGDYREVLEREHVTLDEFLRLTKSDLREMGFPVGIRRRILSFIGK